MSRKSAIALTLVLLAGMGFPEGLEADFSKVDRRLRRELHASGYGPTICGWGTNACELIKSMNFCAARTHDWALGNPNQRVCDWHHMFPLPHLDAKDPRNYVFEPTDLLLRRTREELGMEVFFRLGTSIEHAGTGKHFVSLIPEDFDKTIEVFAGTVRHYNRGWANGFRWNIRYWEIWNEPDGHNTMWCLPDGDGANAAEWAVKDPKRQALFNEFFVKALKRLKSEFGDEIKVGGPAMRGYWVEWFRPLLQACKDAGVAPDFISWHNYGSDPTYMVTTAAEARKLCDEFGFAKCELIANEWHYFGDNYSFSDFGKTDPQVFDRIWDGPDGHNGIRSAAYELTVMSNLQRSYLDQAYYYGHCPKGGYWSVVDDRCRPYKEYYALKRFGEILRDYQQLCSAGSEGNVTIFPVKAVDGRLGLLVTDYGGGGRCRMYRVKVNGLPEDAKPVCSLLDCRHDWDAWPVRLEEGVLTLEKPDFYSAAFWVEFK